MILDALKLYAVVFILFRTYKSFMYMFVTPDDFDVLCAKMQSHAQMMRENPVLSVSTKIGAAWMYMSYMVVLGVCVVLIFF